MRTRSNVTTPDGINWYYEQEGSGHDIVLVPDALGECQVYDKALTLIAATKEFRVTTFDMPGMSRSANAPPESYMQVTAQALAKYVITLLDALKIERASFFGSSAGASTILALVVDYPERVLNAMPHEAPTRTFSVLDRVLKAEDEQLTNELLMWMRVLSANPIAWDALGDEAHARIRKNCIRWARGYTGTVEPSTPVGNLEGLKQRPIDWTIGTSTPTGAFFDNIMTAVKIGANVKLLRGMHLPYVSGPDQFSEYIVETTRKYLQNPEKE